MSKITFTIMNMRENPDISIGDVVTCKVTADCLGKAALDCYLGDKCVGRVVRSGYVGFNMLPNTYELSDKFFQQIPAEFDAKIIASGKINHGRARVVFAAEINLPVKFDETSAKPARENHLHVCKEHIPQMTRDELVALIRATDDALAKL